MLILKKNLPWLIPLLLILILAPFTPKIDMMVESYFFREGQFQANNFLYIIHNFGVVPGWILAISSLMIFLLSLCSPFWKPWRPYALIPLLTIVFGAGMIIDKTFKDHWGRPRPKQTLEFGGNQSYRPFYKPHFFNPEPSKSFPSGHCSMGFYFFSLAFVGRRLNKPWVFWLGITTTVVLGILLGYSRMAQGGHYFSDVIMSAAIMWWTALFFDWLIFQPKKVVDRPLA